MRIFLDVEKVSAAQVIVAPAVIRIDAGSLDRDADRRIFRRFTVQGDGTFEVRERTAYLGQQVPDLKAYLGMVLVNSIGLGGCTLRNA